MNIIVTIGALLSGAFSRKYLLLLAAVLAVGLYIGAMPRTWNLLHYWLNSIYFDQLGYGGIYNCSVDAMPRGWAEYASDLKDYSWQPVQRLPACQRDNFDTGEWGGFAAGFQRLINLGLRPAVLLDKGLNTTPFWMFFSEKIAQNVELSAGLLIDPILLIVGLAFVYWAYGRHVTGLVALFVLGYWGTFEQVYGMWLQFPWLAALMIAMACWKKERFGAAGLAMAAAVGLRVFPAFLLAGPLFKWRQTDRRFWAGLAAGLVLVLVFGSLTSRGPLAWLEWAGKMSLHSEKLINLALNIGAKNMVYTLLHPGQVADFFNDFRTGDVRGNYQAEGLLIVTAVSAVLVLVSILIARVKGTFSSGLPLIFAAVVLSSYYWLVLIIPLMEDEKARPWIMGLAALGLFLVAVWNGLGGWIVFQFLLFVFLFAHYGKGVINVPSIRNRQSARNTA